jgi:MFS transporter, DHA3 family, macrolide efflux protein
LLADYIMEPAMRSQNWLSGAFGWMTGTGPGAGMALMMVVFGLLTMLTMSSGFIFPGIRNIEDLLPDHDELQKVEEGSQT